jgi:hypothetical protein
VSSARDEELEEFRDDALSEDARRAFRASAEVTACWDRAHPLDVNAILDWIEELRQVFGDPKLDRRPWRGNDFRL